MERNGFQAKPTHFVERSPARFMRFRVAGGFGFRVWGLGAYQIHRYLLAP